MVTESTNSLLNSLRGRILLATGALIVFSAFCGLLAYLAVSFFAVSAIYPVAAVVIGTSGSIAVFGWWLSNEMIRPIDTVALLARSLERSPTASLPKTTGAAETDEVLQILHRNSQQLQNLIGLMDDVSSGRTEAAMAPLQNPDRLSVSFQKLVSKVTESIKAKQQLDILQGSVNRLNSAVAGIRGGNLRFEPAGEPGQMLEIIEAIRFLVGKLNAAVDHAASASATITEAADDTRKAVRAAIESEELASARAAKAAGTLSKSAGTLRELSSQFEHVVADMSSSFTSGDAGADPNALSEAVDRLRRQLTESIRHAGQLRERANSVPQSARSVGELARRANLLAINTTLQANAGGNADVISGEIASLATRGESVGKEISSVSESLSAELSHLDEALAAINSELSDISAAGSRHVDTSAVLTAHMARLESLRSRLAEHARDDASQRESVVNALTRRAETDVAAPDLKKAEQLLDAMGAAAASIQDSVTGLRIAPAYAVSAPAIGAAAESVIAAPPGDIIRGE